MSSYTRYFLNLSWLQVLRSGCSVQYVCGFVTLPICIYIYVSIFGRSSSLPKNVFISCIPSILNLSSSSLTISLQLQLFRNGFLNPESEAGKRERDRRAVCLPLSYNCLKSQCSIINQRAPLLTQQTPLRLHIPSLTPRVRSL